jgi:type II secretory pathway pseudopilin PulG
MSNRSRARVGKRAEGFTLIEMLVSVTLIMLIAVCLWAVMRICISTWKRGTESMDENQRHRATLDLVQKQMSSISGLVPTLDLQTGAGQAPVFWGSPNTVQFISLCPLRFRDNPGLTSVTYDIVPSDNGGYALVARESRYLGGDPTLAAGIEDTSEPATTIFDHLTSASFEYFDPGNREIPPQWVTDWSAQEKMSLPTAISMTVNARDTNGVIQSRKVVVPIMAEPDTTTTGFVDPFETQAGGGGFNPFVGRQTGGGPPPPPGRRGGPGDNPLPGGRRGGPGFGNPQFPPGGRRGGDIFTDPRQGRGRGGRF